MFYDFLIFACFKTVGKQSVGKFDAQNAQKIVQIA